MLLEVAVGLVVAWRTFGGAPSHPANWVFAITLGLLLASGLRIYARIQSAYSEKCRRIAARSAGEGRDVTATTCSNLDSDKPSLTDWLARRLPARDLKTYFESTKPSGESGYREVVAHSAFYTWRILRRAAGLYALATIALFAFAITVIFYMAAEPLDRSLTEKVLDVVCSLIVVLLAAKAFDASAAAYISSR
jgi:hypothetical protein